MPLETSLQQPGGREYLSEDEVFGAPPTEISGPEYITEEQAFGPVQVSGITPEQPRGKTSQRWEIGQDLGWLNDTAFKFVTGQLPKTEYLKQKEALKNKWKGKDTEGQTWLEESFLSAVETSPTAAEGVLRGAKTGAALTAVVAPIAAVSGVPAAPIAATAWTTGQMYGSMRFWWEQGTGEIYRALEEEGVSDNTARWVSALAAIPYAAIEFSQVEKMVPGFKKLAINRIKGTTKRILAQLGLRYGINVVTETIEEVTQEEVKQIADEYAKSLDDIYKDALPDRLSKNLSQLGQTALKTVGPMAFLLAPGTAVTGAASILDREGKPAAPAPPQVPPVIPTPGAAATVQPGTAPRAQLELPLVTQPVARFRGRAGEIIDIDLTGTSLQDAITVMGRRGAKYVETVQPPLDAASAAAKARAVGLPQTAAAVEGRTPPVIVPGAEPAAMAQPPTAPVAIPPTPRVTQRAAEIVVPGETEPVIPRVSAIEEIRAANARTTSQIQRLFPQAGLSREQARDLRNAAWGAPVVPAATIPPASTLPTTPVPEVAPTVPIQPEPTPPPAAEAVPPTAPVPVIPAVPTVLTPTPRVTQRAAQIAVPGEAEPLPVRLTAVEEIRAANARTIAQIQRLFPQANLNREQARALRNDAWGVQPPPTPAAQMARPGAQMPPAAPVQVPAAVTPPQPARVVQAAPSATVTVPVRTQKGVSVLATIRQLFPHLPMLEVVDTARQFPEAIKQDAIRRGRSLDSIDAVYYNGRIIFNASRFRSTNPALISQKVVHEASTHLGLRRALGPDKFSELARSIWNNLSAADRERIAQRQGATTESFEEIGEEWLGYEAERVLADNKTNTFWSKVAAQIRSGLRRLGLHRFGLKLAYSDIEIARLIAKGMQAAQEPPKTEYPAPNPLATVDTIRYSFAEVKKVTLAGRREYVPTTVGAEIQNSFEGVKKMLYIEARILSDLIPPTTAWHQPREGQSLIEYLRRFYSPEGIELLRQTFSRAMPPEFVRDKKTWWNIKKEWDAVESGRDPLVRGRQFLADNRKTGGVSLDFSFGTCLPTENCSVCYAKGVQRPFIATRARTRHSIVMSAFPRQVGQLVSGYIKSQPKGEVPFLRINGAGDTTFAWQAELVNTIIQNLDRPVHIFSRSHVSRAAGTTGLDSILNGWFDPNDVANGVAVYKMGSIDRQLMDEYGIPFLKQNLERRGIINCYLVKDAEDIPRLQQLVRNNVHFVMHVNATKATIEALKDAGLLASTKQINEDVGMTAPACPCSLETGPFINGCASCLLMGGPCSAMGSQIAMSQTGQLVPMRKLLTGRTIPPAGRLAQMSVVGVPVERDAIMAQVAATGYDQAATLLELNVKSTLSEKNKKYGNPVNVENPIDRTTILIAKTRDEKQNALDIAQDWRSFAANLRSLATLATEGTGFARFMAERQLPLVAAEERLKREGIAAMDRAIANGTQQPTNMLREQASNDDLALANAASDAAEARLDQVAKGSNPYGQQPRGMRFDLRKGGQAGFIDLQILDDLVTAGARILRQLGQWTATQAVWAKAMVTRFGNWITVYLDATWRKLARLQSQASNNVNGNVQGHIATIEATAEKDIEDFNKPTYDAETLRRGAPGFITRNLRRTSEILIRLGGPELKQARLEVAIQEATTRAAIRRQSEDLTRNLVESARTANPMKRWYLPAWLIATPRAKKFMQRTLHIAARLNAIGKDKWGNFTFGDFDARAGIMTESEGKRLGLTTGDSFIQHHPISNQLETLRVGDLIRSETGARFYQVLRPMSAQDQEQLYRHYKNEYLDLIWFLDMWIDPDLANMRQTINNIQIPVFNRFSLAAMMAQDHPEFTPLTAYTPDVLITRSLLGRIAGFFYRAGTRSPGRKYKTGRSREIGNVRDLLSGFNVRAWQMFAERSRKQWMQAVMASALPIPKAGLPPGWVKLDTGMEDLWRAVRRLRNWESPVDPDTGDPLFPQTQDRLTDDDSKEYRAFVGETYALRGKQLMLPETLIYRLKTAYIERAKQAKLWRMLAWMTRNSKQLFLAVPKAYVTNVLTNDLFTVQRMVNSIIAGVIGMDMMDIRFARELFVAETFKWFPGLRSLVDRRFRWSIENVLPREVFAESTGLRDLAIRYDETPRELLRRTEIGGAVLQLIRYGDIDIRPKQRMAYAWLRAKAITEAKSKGLSGPSLRAYVDQYMQNPSIADRAQAVDLANFELLNYSDTPEALNAAQRSYETSTNLTLPFFRFAYHYISKSAKEASGLRRLLSAVPRQQRSDALADFITFLLFPMGGLGLIGFAMMKALGADDDDMKMLMGTSFVTRLDPQGNPITKPIERELITANRLNISAWARILGLGEENEDDFWIRVRNYPMIAMAGAAFKAMQDWKQFGAMAGVRAFASSLQDLYSDFFTLGWLFKVPSKIYQELGYHPTSPSTFDPYSGNIPLLAYLTDQTMDSFVPGTRQFDLVIRWMDPIERRRTRSKMLDFEPGAWDGARVSHVTGMLDRFFAGREGTFESTLPPSGEIRGRTVPRPKEISLTERVAELFGFNIRSVERARYKKALKGNQ